MNDSITINVKNPDMGVEYGALDMTITISAEATIHTFLDACERAALALTYHPNSWRDAIIDKARIYEHSMNKETHRAY